VIPGVPRLAFGPENDVFCSAVTLLLNHLGDRAATYHDMVGLSGRCFKVAWNDRKFFWDRFGEQPDGDPDYHLRREYTSARAAVEAMGYSVKFLRNASMRGPSVFGAPVETETRPVSPADMREAIVATVRDGGRPVIASVNVMGTTWAPEWSVITGFDEGGRVLIGWSCFQDFPQAKRAVSYEPGPDTYFRLGDWGQSLVVVALVEGQKRDVDLPPIIRRSLEGGVGDVRGFDKGYEHFGLRAYEAWASAVESTDIAGLEDGVAAGRLEYHANLTGHVAAQKHYCQEWLRRLERRGWNVSSLLHAAAHCSKIHELAWESWKVAGGYWRPREGEVARFKNSANRAAIAGIIRQMGDQDRAMLACLEDVLAGWEKGHGYYLKSL
jgi:hypothetical protein